MSGYARFSSQEAANINTFGSDVKDAIVLPDDGFVVRIKTAQGDFFSLPCTSYAAASATAERLLCA
ncbi:hypothetical protein [Microvirga sp. BSC39]|uniref:hypothetical protein n=1 Tax=Microvirga sp. BSC39 TaxID=1549810 RepID=UPI0004E905E2|nr:hypothetical protein [Microvirga sp. BSC39]KFG67637.1 hypothetical protein JH26_22025 [Microvirga sp. BSC39]